MTPPEKAALIKDLHVAYIAATGYEITLNALRERQWWEWCSFSGWAWTCDDLKRTIHYLRGQIKNDKRNDGALKFTNLICNPDKFEEDLALAREASKGNPLFHHKPKPKASAPVVADPAEIITGKEGAALFLRGLTNPPPVPDPRG